LRATIRWVSPLKEATASLYGTPAGGGDESAGTDAQAASKPNRNVPQFLCALLLEISHWFTVGESAHAAKMKETRKRL
jgi:hypothetical protein